MACNDTIKNCYKKYQGNGENEKNEHFLLYSMENVKKYVTIQWFSEWVLKMCGVWNGNNAIFYWLVGMNWTLMRDLWDLFWIGNLLYLLVFTHNVTKKEIKTRKRQTEVKV